MILETWEGVEPRPVAKIPLVLFEGDDFLNSVGDGFFKESDDSGAPVIADAEVAGRGEVVTQ
jgi:flagellar hook protein FlgE